MSLYTYISEDCKEDIQKYNCMPQIRKLEERVFRNQRPVGLDNFPHPFWVKKKFPLDNFRTVCYLHKTGKNEDGDEILCFLRVLKRASREYELFSSDAKSFSPSETLLEKAEKKMNQDKQVAPPIEKCPPSEQENAYLYNVFSQRDKKQDFFICESSEWVKNIRTKNEFLRKLRPLIEQLIDDENDTPVTEERMDEYTLVYRNFGTHKKLFLAGIVEDGKAKELYETYEEVLLPESVSEEAILKHSRRQYEWGILDSVKAWEALEKDEDANLALSSEETAILEAVMMSATRGEPKDKANGYPLFINGRAGSGKSTILQYLFAHYMKFYLKNKNSSEFLPIYFSCSRELIKKSKEIIATLLSLNYEYIDTKSNFSSSSINSLSDNIFHEFHAYLYKQLPREKRQNFQRNKYVDYSRFRQLWSEKFSCLAVNQKKLFNPDISWHVIRTYIKGYSMAIMEPDDYRELPEKLKSITDDTFNQVFSNVWKWYSESNYWDDQDLSRYLLENEIIKSQHPVIFCDEAQDFTRIELELILRLNLFYDRKLYPQVLPRIPIAFAGDEFQTLNPTGFRWDQVKAAFVEKLILGLDPASRSGRSDINFRELFYNYRSGKQIVNLCNIIQILRCALFDIHSNVLQEYWGEAGNTVSPQYFSIETKTADIQTALAKNPELVIIVPCLKDEEVSFVKNDAFLKECIECIKDHDDVEIAPRVYSSERIKGLEYEQAVIYGFGETLPDSIKDAIQDGKLTHNNSIGLEEEYFFNRLYVAASRARKKLFIIDTENGIREFWQKLTSEDFRDNLIESVKIEDADRLHPAVIDQGMVSFLAEQVVDSLSTAEVSFRQGCALKDSYYLRQSAISYENAATLPEYSMRGKEFEKLAQFARAKANYFDGDYSKAAIQFMNAEKYEDAMFSYWKLNSEESWKGIKQCSELDRALERCLEAHIARFIVDKKDNIDDFVLLLQTAADQIEVYEEKFLEDIIWSSIFTQMLNDFRYVLKDTPKNTDKRINLNLEKLENAGIEIKPHDLRAIYHFYAGKYQEAINSFEKTINRPKEYWLAKLELSSYPDSIVPMYQLANFEQTYYKKAFNTFVKHRDINLSQDQIKIMSQICLTVNKLDDASSLLGELENITDIIRVIQELKRANKKIAMLVVADRFIKQCIKLNFGNTAFNFVLQRNKENEFPNGETFNAIELELLESELKHLRVTLLRTMVNEEYINAGFYNYWQLAKLFDKRKEYSMAEKSLGLLAGALVRKRRYEDIFRLFHDLDIVNLADKPEEVEIMADSNSLSLPEEYRKNVLMYWLAALSKTKIREDELPPDIASYINNDLKQLIKKYEENEKLPEDVSLVHIGVMVENGFGYSGTFLYKIAFYEKVKEHLEPSVDLIFVYLRLAFLYSDFAEYLKKKEREKNASVYRAKLAEIEDILGMKIHEQLPRQINVFLTLSEIVENVVNDYGPIINKIKNIRDAKKKISSTNHVPPGSTTVDNSHMPPLKSSKLNFRPFNKKGRIRIENEEGDQVTFDLPSMTLKSDDVEVKQLSPNHFICPEWWLDINVKDEVVFIESTNTGEKKRFELDKKL